jgi:hypothetical protein
LSQVIKLKKQGHLISEYYLSTIEESDSEADRKKKYEYQKYKRMDIEKIITARDIYYNMKWITVNDDSLNCFQQMLDQASYISGNVDVIIDDFLNKNPDLKEFLAVHGDENIRENYVPGVLEKINRRPVYIPKSETKIWDIVKAFNGKPIKYDRYPISISIKNDLFVITDIDFETPKTQFVDDWNKAPVLVL